MGKYIVWDKELSQVHRGPWSKTDVTGWIKECEGIFGISESAVASVFEARKFHTHGTRRGLAIGLIAGAATGVGLLTWGILTDRVIIEKHRVVMDTTPMPKKES